MSTKLSERELADRQLAFDELKESDAWKLLEQRLDELEINFSKTLGQSLIRSQQPKRDHTITHDDMLQAFVDIAYKRGIIRGMGLIVREPERIARDFEAAFKEKGDV